MNDSCFIDSNICLYLLGGNLLKKEIAKNVLLKNSFISTQVIAESINIIYKKFKQLSLGDLKRHVQLLLKNNTLVLIDAGTISTAIFIKEKYALQWYDSLIASAALQAGCAIIYTENMHHGLVIKNTLTVINSFVGV